MTTPKQIGDVVGVDRMDTLDRQKLDPCIKLQLLAAETRSKYDTDPRNGKFAFVARPRILLQLLIDMKVGAFSSDLRLERPIIIGSAGADMIARWEGVPILVRCNVRDDNLHCLPLDKIPESKPIDRQRAGQLRVCAHAGTLENLREGD